MAPEAPAPPSPPSPSMGGRGNMPIAGFRLPSLRASAGGGGALGGNTLLPPWAIRVLIYVATVSVLGDVVTTGPRSGWQQIVAWTGGFLFLATFPVMFRNPD